MNRMTGDTVGSVSRRSSRRKGGGEAIAVIPAILGHEVEPAVDCGRLGQGTGEQVRVVVVDVSI